MRPEIETYLREHGATYTTESLRKQLIGAGHDPDEVDAALRESEAWRAPQLAEARGSRSRFWWSVFGLHLAVLVGVSVWVFTRNYTYAPFAAVILGLMLLGGLGISGLIGRMLQPRTGLMAALIVPLISALGLGGLCLATISGTQIHVPPRPGVMELTIHPPLSFEGSGPAECVIPQGGFSVYGPDLGTLDGRLVSASLSSAGDPASQPSASASYRTVYLYVNLLPRVGVGGETAYGVPGDGTVELDAASDGLSGTLSFEGLVAQEFEGHVAGPPISGTLSWTCE
ncbi:MAG: hypothetical protein WD402_10600 [Chloroflexota bacterium]